MPIPKPNSGESQDKFISRCMSTLKKEFPDQKQRTAVCFGAFRKARGGKPPKENRDEKGRLIIAENVPIVMTATIGESL